MGQLHDLTALEQVAAIRRRELSAAELVGHYLTRIEAHDPQLGGFVTVTAELALAAAGEVDQQSGRDPGLLAPLAGLPIAIKDLTLTSGVRTSFGSVVFENFIPRQDADVVTALRAAGTVSQIGRAHV